MGQADTAMQKSFSPAPTLSQENISSLNSRYGQLNRKLTQSVSRLLQKMQRLELKLQRKLSPKDTVSTRQAFAGVQEKYAGFLGQVAAAKNDPAITSLKEYVPRLDSLRNAFQFMQKMNGANTAALTNTIGSLQSGLNLASGVKQFLRERKQVLKKQLEQSGLGKELKQLNKEVYYYQQQLDEYKALLHSPDKLVEKALVAVRDQPAFQTFMNQHSLLAQMFGLPGGNNAALSLVGLQTREAVQNQLGAQLGSGANTGQYMQQQVQQAQAEMNKLKDKVNQWGGGNNDMEIPEFKPNNQKTKTFWERIEYGLNIQSQKTNLLLPVTTDFALTAGYKLNDKSTIGIGASYKMGWGKNISNIKITSQGLGLRSYIDVKLKGSIWISGGYEYNYQQEFSKLDQLKDLNAWQQSGLIGLTKKYRVGKKNGNLQLLWDFLSYSQVPKTQALKFRIGYLF